MVNQFIRLALAAGVLLLLAGCGIKSEGLVPEEMNAADRTIKKRVKLMPVLGGHASKFGREAYITNEQYYEALKRTLLGTGIFKELVESGAADLELHSEIITITTEAGLSPEYAIVVQYWLTEPNAGEEVWRKGINTRHQVKWNEHLAGATRIIKAVEGATQKNLTQLVDALAASGL